MRDHSRRIQSGFTLVELLVVVSILAALAGITASAVTNYEQQARLELAATELKTIANALYRFKADTGYFPKQGLFSSADTQAQEVVDQSFDLSFLFASPELSGNEIMPFDVNSGFGWNGPYLSVDSQQRLHVPTGSPARSDCALVAVTVANSVLSLDDGFTQPNTYSDTDRCFVVFSDGQWVPSEGAGQPYLYTTDFRNDAIPGCTAAGNGCVAILSAGPNGLHENADGDDLFRILEVRP